MNYEKEYIEYLIENVKNLDTEFLDRYFLDKIDFEELIELIDTTKYNIISYKNFVKSKNIDDILG
jgi:hypothetical protein